MENWYKGVFSSSDPENLYVTGLNLAHTAHLPMVCQTTTEDR